MFFPPHSFLPSTSSPDRPGWPPISLPPSRLLPSFRSPSPPSSGFANRVEESQSSARWEEERRKGRNFSFGVLSLSLSPHPSPLSSSSLRLFLSRLSSFFWFDSFLFLFLSFFLPSTFLFPSQRPHTFVQGIGGRRRRRDGRRRRRRRRR